MLGKLLGEAIKNLFVSYFEAKQFRASIEWFEGGKSFVTGDRQPSKEYLRRLDEAPVLKKEVTHFLERSELQDITRQAPDELAASVAEFILEGLHVENRLNKNLRGGESVFRR